MTDHRIVRFLIVGLGGSVLYACLVFLLSVALRAPMMLASSLSFILVSVLNYFFHYKWTFASRKSHSIAFSQFMTVSVVGFILNNAVVYCGKIMLDFNIFLVQFCAICVVVVSNYVLNTYWTFRQSSAAE